MGCAVEADDGHDVFYAVHFLYQLLDLPLDGVGVGERQAVGELGGYEDVAGILFGNKALRGRPEQVHRKPEQRDIENHHYRGESHQPFDKRAVFFGHP